ncbi:MAG: hypothetical protein HY898_26715 [Deltaproteobacteria bacterium]|nr:hypothetical protein [Deltaproteobacteria bacterium]
MLRPRRFPALIALATLTAIAWGGCKLDNFGTAADVPDSGVVDSSQPEETSVGQDGSDVSVIEARDDEPAAPDAADDVPQDDAQADAEPEVGADADADTVDAKCPANKDDCDGNGTCEASLKDDPANCGACGHDCLGSECLQGMCKPLLVADGLQSPNGIAVNAKWLVWTNYYGGTVYKAPLPLSTPSGATLLSISTGGPGAIVIDDVNTYWAESDVGTVMQVLTEVGGLPTYLAVGLDRPAGLAQDATSVYVSTRGTVTSLSEIKRIPKSGGTAIAIASDAAGASGLAIDAASVYWANSTTGVIWKAPLDLSGTPTQLAAGQASPLGVAVDNVSVYWTSSSAAVVMKVPKAGGTATKLSTGMNPTAGIVVDGAFAWFAETTSGSIRRVSTQGGPYQTIVYGALSPLNLAIDSKLVYWTNWNQGSVMAVAR